MVEPMTNSLYAQAVRYEIDGRIYRVASLREAIDALAVLKGEAVRDERAPMFMYRLIDGQVCIDEGASRPLA